MKIFARYIFFCVIIFNFNASKSNDALKAAINNKYRDDKNITRDVYRNPYETLNFFGLEKNMKVLEIVPGRGWYTEILSTYMKKTNNFYVATYREPQYAIDIITKIQNEFYEYFDKNQEKFGEIKIVSIDKNLKLESDIEYFDLVLTFRNTHNFLDQKKSENILKSIYSSLKKGGVLGVVQHRANESAKKDFDKGYVKEEFLIKHIEKFGFQLVDKSEINANPKDLKNYKKGVWSLPPRYANGDENKSYFKSIGESDRMTLKFKKK